MLVGLLRPALSNSPPWSIVKWGVEEVCMKVLVLLPQNRRRDNDSYRYAVKVPGRVAHHRLGIITRSCMETHQPRDGNANQWSKPR